MEASCVFALQVSAGEKKYPGNRPCPEGRSSGFADDSRWFTVQRARAKLSRGMHNAVGRANKRKNPEMGGEHVGHQRSRALEEGGPKGNLLCGQTATRAHSASMSMTLPFSPTPHSTQGPLCSSSDMPFALPFLLFFY